MKRLILTVVVAVISMFAFANMAKYPSFLLDGSKLSFEMKSDSAINVVNENLSNTQLLDKCINFYDIERLVIKNENHKRIMVVNSKNEIVIDTNDSIDIQVPAGNYYVYCSAAVKSYMRYE